MPCVLVDLHDLLEDRADQPRRDAERRLVEHQEFRVAHQRAADGEHLLLAAGERAGGLLHAFFQPRENRENVIAVLRVQRGVVLQIGAHREILVDGEIRENHPALRHMAKSARHDPMRRQRRDVFAEKRDLARLRSQQSGDRAQRGGLPRAVAADQRDDRALLDLERDAAERGDRAVGNVEIGDGRALRMRIADQRLRRVWISSRSRIATDA